MQRRTFLAVAAGSAIAGCSGGGGTASPTRTPTKTGTETATRTATRTETATATTTTTGRRVAFSEAWSKRLGLTGAGSGNYETAIAGDTLLLANSGGVMAMAIEDGARRWTYSEVTDFANLVVGEYVYAVGKAGELVALDPATGEVEWEANYTSADSVLAKAEATTNHVVVGGNENTRIFDQTDGTEVATIDEDPFALEARDDQVYVATGFDLVAYDVPAGTKAWSVGAEIGADPAVTGSTLVGTTRSGFVAVDLDAREKLWSVEVSGEFTSTPVVATEDRAFGLSTFGEPRLIAVDTNAGAIDWTRKLDITVSFEPVLAGGAVFVQGPDSVLALDPETGDTWDSAGGELVITAAGTDSKFFECGRSVTAYDLVAG